MIHMKYDIKNLGKLSSFFNFPKKKKKKYQFPQVFQLYFFGKKTLSQYLKVGKKNLELLIFSLLLNIRLVINR